MAVKQINQIQEVELGKIRIDRGQPFKSEPALFSEDKSQNNNQNQNKTGAKPIIRRVGGKTFKNLQI